MARLGLALVGGGQTIAVVECTLGGRLGGVLTAAPGASAWFVASIAPYSADAKQRLLGVPPASAVSSETARALAEAARARLGADWALAETGIAGPRGRHRSAKEPGTWFACLVGPGAIHARSLSTGRDDRRGNREAFLKAALELLSRI